MLDDILVKSSNNYTSIFELTFGVIHVAASNIVQFSKFSFEGLNQYEGMLVGEYDYVRLHRTSFDAQLKEAAESGNLASSDSNAWVMNTTSKQCMLIHDSLNLNGTSICDGLKSLSLIVNVSLLKPDFRLAFAEEVRSRFERMSSQIQSSAFLSFGADDAVLLFSIETIEQAKIVNKMLMQIFDSSYVSRTERIYTEKFINIALEKYEEFSSNYAFALKIKLKSGQKVKLERFLKILKHKIKNTQALEASEISLNNGTLDISLPIKNANSRVFELRKQIAEDSELKSFVQRMHTDVRYFNFIDDLD